MSDSHRGHRIGAILLGVVTIGVGLAWVLSWLQRAPDGPVPIVWDEEVCAHCRMHIGEPGFAAQLQTEVGEVLNFDDPGCLFELMEADAAGSYRPAAIYFRHLREERWLRAPDVAFERVERTPMGFGLGAVDPGTPGALSFEEARRHVSSPSAANQEH